MTATKDKTKDKRRAAADADEIGEVATALSTALVKSGVIGVLVETDRDGGAWGCGTATSVPPRADGWPMTHRRSC
jgi:hypothetical protein